MGGLDALGCLKISMMEFRGELDVRRREQSYGTSCCQVINADAVSYLFQAPNDQSTTSNVQIPRTLS